MENKKITNIPIEEILEWLQISGTNIMLITTSDILPYIHLSKSETAYLKQEFSNLKNLDFQKLAKFLIDHEKDLDKTKFLTKMLYSYKKVLEQINKDSTNAHELISQSICTTIKTMEENLKGINQIIYVNDGKGIKGISCQEIISGVRRTKNQKRLQALENSGVTLKDLLNVPPILSDLENFKIAKDNSLIQLLKRQSLSYYISSYKKINKEETAIGRNSIYDLYKKIDREATPEIESTLRNNIEYIHFDKLLLRTAYRIINDIEEHHFLEPDEIKEKNSILKVLYNNLLSEKSRKSSKEGIKGEINKLLKDGQIKKDYISFNLNDLKKALQRFEAKDNGEIVYYNKEEWEQIQKTKAAEKIERENATEEAKRVAEKEKTNATHKMVDDYLSTGDASIFIEAIRKEQISFKDCKIISSNDWIEIFLEGQIPWDCFEKLQQAGAVNQNISVNTLLQNCDKDIVKVKGTAFNEIINKIISNKERKKAGETIKKYYSFKSYKTIKPGLAGYNANLIGRNDIIDIIEGMQISSQELTKLCQEGLLTGDKIAELAVRGLISESNYKCLKKQGLVTREEDIKASNGITESEFNELLKGSGIHITQIGDEFLSTQEGGRRTVRLNRHPNSDIELNDDNVINPKIRRDILLLLGANEKIVGVKEFKGYVGYKLPKFGVVVLEKWYKTQKGNEYNYGDATYICDKGQLLRKVYETKNEAKTSGSKIVYHNHNWAKTLLYRIAEVVDGKVISKGDNITGFYLANGEKVDLDYNQYNIISQEMQNGKYDIKQGENRNE